jgi:hypothetical protein
VNIKLTPENEARYRKASVQLDRSTADVVNTVLAAVEMVEISQVTKLELRVSPDPNAPRKPIKRATIYKTTL